MAITKRIVSMAFTLSRLPDAGRATRLGNGSRLRIGCNGLQVGRRPVGYNRWSPVRQLCWHAVAHGDERVRYVEVVSDAANDYDGRHAQFACQVSCPLDGRHDRLELVWYELLHASVADHEVGGGGVFVDEQAGGTQFDRLADGCELRG